MVSREKFLDDIAKIAGDAVGVISDVSKQANENIRSRVDDLSVKMDLVPRQDFEELEMMVIKAREEIEELKKRIEVLETPSKTKKSKSKTTSKKRKTGQKKSKD